MFLTSSCFCIDGGSISLSVGSGSSLGESCGICGTQSGELVYLNGTAATNPAEQLEVVESYRVPAADMSLRPIRPECGEENTFAGFHLGISSWGGSSWITWPYGHGEWRVDFIIISILGGGEVGSVWGGS